MEFSENVSIYVKTTDTCQLNCKHCYTGGSSGSKTVFNPHDVADFICDLRLVHPEIKNVIYSFHGGEPMLVDPVKMNMFRAMTSHVFDDAEYRIQTNLIYELNCERRKFLNSLSSIGVSWDHDLRFHKEEWLSLWMNNVLKLVQDGNEMTMTVSLSKGTIERYEPKDIIKWAADIGFKYILFERITPTGNATLNTSIIPSNTQLDKWFLDMYNQSVEEGLYKKIYNMFLGSIMGSYVHGFHQGCRTRSCEKNVITINADGTIGGCPDSAPIKSYSDIYQPIDEIFSSKQRIDNIACEMCRNIACYKCPIFDVCNGDCYQLKWDDTCPAPKSLISKMKQENDIEMYKNFIV